MTPVLGVILTHLKAHENLNWLMLPAMIAFFVIPVSLVTVDFRCIAMRRRQTGGWFRPQDFRDLYFPTWGRMIIWFVGSAVSMFLSQWLGVPIG